MKEEVVEKQSNLVFVYGSLLSGLMNNGLLAGAVLKGKATTVAEYAMRDLGAFPAVVINEKVAPVVGEVYEVDAPLLKRLDWLEGYPSFYTRSQIKLQEFGDNEAWMYHLANQKVAYRGDSAVRVNTEGLLDWRKHLAGKQSH